MSRRNSQSSIYSASGISRLHSFEGSFWGPDDKGLDVISKRLSQGKHTAKGILELISAKASLEQSYGKDMMKISKLSLGQEEIGSLRETIEGIRSEYESIANNHLMLSQKIKKEIETPLAEFLSLQREIKINHITASEKNLKAKSLQKQSVLAAKKRYELKCSEVNNLIAAKSVASGKELDKLSSKLEKVQAGMNSADQDYQRAVAQLKKAAETWEIDWRESLKMFEYLEFKRMEQLQKSLLNLQSLLQHTCQSDSYSNDQILNLLNVINVREDLELFVKQNATGDVIHEPMEYKNFYAPASTTPKTRLAITPPDLSSASLPAVELIDQSNPENENPSGSHSPNDAGKNMYINTSPAQYQGSNEQRPSETMPGSLPISMRDASVINLISSTGEGYGYDYNDGPVNGSGEIGLKSTKFEPESDAPDAQSVLSPPPNYDAVTPFPPQQLSNKPPLTAGQTANSTPESRSEPSQSTPHISQLSTDDDGQSASGTDTPPKLKNRRSSSLTKIHSSMMRAIHNIVEGMHSTTAEMEQHASDNSNPSTKSSKNEAKPKKDKKGKEHEKEGLKENLKSMHISTNEDFKPNESRQNLPIDVMERGRPVDEVGGDASRSKSKSRSASPTGKSTRSNHSNKSSESFKASIQHPAALVQPQPSRTSSHIQSMSSISFQPPHQPAEYVQAPQTQQQSQQAQYKLRLLSASPIQSNSIQSVHPTVIDTVYRPPSNSPPVTSMLPPSAPGSASSEVSTGKSNPNFNRVNESGTDRPKSNVSVSGVGLSRQTSRALRIPVRNSLEGYANGNGLESENERTGQSQNKNRISTTSGGDSRPSSSISQFSDPASGHRPLAQSQSQAVSNIYRPGPSHIASAGIQQASADPSVMSTNKSMKINQSYPQSSSPYSNQDPRPQHQQQQKQPTSMSQSSPNMTNRQPATVAQTYSVYQPQMIPASTPSQIPPQQQMQQPQQSVQMDGRPGSVPGPMNLYMDPHDLIVNPAIQVPVLFYVRALYDYNAQIPEELDLDRGQVLAVLATQEDGWWIAELQIGRQKRRGYIPSNFVEEYVG